MAKHYQDIMELITVCESELIDRGYRKERCKLMRTEWGNFATWMKKQGYKALTEEIGMQYCNERFGSNTFPSIKKSDRTYFRAIRMLISYQAYGFFEFRSPTATPKKFIGETGRMMETYLLWLTHNKKLSAGTLEEKRRHLCAFNAYMENESIPVLELKTETLTVFYELSNYTLPKKQILSIALKDFLRYIFDIGAVSKDMSYIVMPVSKGQKKLPTTYTEEEIKRMLAAVERGSDIGKRDYLVLLLAAEFGWRASDIVNFSFSWIDWDKNTISFDQQKTGVAVRYPLLSSVGNAIVDYLKHGRPKTTVQEIIVAHDIGTRGEKLRTPTLHSIVTKYLRAANIENWKQKKHGTHALRHSLATNLLKKNASLPMIASILGHQRTETTKIYISLDIDQLKQCALPMPKLNTNVFEVIL